jgi:hypothetical protein
MPIGFTRRHPARQDADGCLPNRPVAALYKWSRIMFFRGSARVRIGRCMKLALLAGWLSFICLGTANGSVWKNAERMHATPVPATPTDYFLTQKSSKPNPYWDNLTPEERTRMQRQYREWQSLPPEQRETMRQRMDGLRRMPPQDRERYQQRYQQWQQLTPEDRHRLENNLQRWDNLSPQERESIRQRFKK